MFFFFQPDDDPDAKKLAALLAADDVLGADFWTWSMLAEWGASLNPQEAEERIEQGYLDNPVRSELSKKKSIKPRPTIPYLYHSPIYPLCTNAQVR